MLGAECGITFFGFASEKVKPFIQTQRSSSEVGQTTGLMGDRAARIGGYGFPVPRARPGGAKGGGGAADESRRGTAASWPPG